MQTYLLEAQTLVEPKRATILGTHIEAKKALPAYPGLMLDVGQDRTGNTRTPLICSHCDTCHEAFTPLDLMIEQGKGQECTEHGPKAELLAKDLLSYSSIITPHLPRTHRRRTDHHTLVLGHKDATERRRSLALPYQCEDCNTPFHPVLPEGTTKLVGKGLTVQGKDMLKVIGLGQPDGHGKRLSPLVCSLLILCIMPYLRVSCHELRRSCYTVRNIRRLQALSQLGNLPIEARRYLTVHVTTETCGLQLAPQKQHVDSGADRGQ